MKPAISLILPYWDRQAAADRALQSLVLHYARLPLEVVVVDDGNLVPFVEPISSLNIRVVRLPAKRHPTPQSRAWNAGVREASADLIALSCVEVIHKRPVLEPMAAQLAALGPDGYVLAAAWCPERKNWDVRSDIAPWDRLPKGVGGCFLGMLHRSLFERVGGFDEDYQDGAGYEDQDFIMRLVTAGAVIVVRDDLVVIHPKTGATIKWPAEGFARNLERFKRKWPTLSA